MTRRWSSDLPSSSFCTELAISPLPSVRFGINGYQEVSQECEGRMSMKEADFGEKENQSQRQGLGAPQDGTMGVLLPVDTLPLPQAV